MSALIALFHMAAEHSGSAVANVVESLSLVRREHVLPPVQEVLLVSAEDIGHFRPMRSHHSDRIVVAALTTSSGLSRSSGLLQSAAVSMT